MCLLWQYDITSVSCQSSISSGNDNMPVVNGDGQNVSHGRKIVQEFHGHLEWRCRTTTISSFLRCVIVIFSGENKYESSGRPFVITVVCRSCNVWHSLEDCFIMLPGFQTVPLRKPFVYRFVIFMKGSLTTITSDWQSSQAWPAAAAAWLDITNNLNFHSVRHSPMPNTVDFCYVIANNWSLFLFALCWVVWHNVHS